MLEKMIEFFEKRIAEYDEHMLNEIDFAREFYTFTAELLPSGKDCHILDLGCGTGLELEFYFKINPHAQVTGIDLSLKMLDALNLKFNDKKLNLIQGSYFDVSIAENTYDGAVSVESLHHFTKEEKLPLYEKIHKSLKKHGYFVLTDYFSLSNAEEEMHRRNYMNLIQEQGINDDEFYHYDTPLTVEHETETLIGAGFSTIEVQKNWGATYTIKAVK